jgi:hypothetical protein
MADVRGFKMGDEGIVYVIGQMLKGDPTPRSGRDLGATRLRVEATPIAVSLAVLGRHVPGLQPLAVLLGGDPVIGTEIGFYQRLLARGRSSRGLSMRCLHGRLAMARRVRHVSQKA